MKYESGSFMISMKYYIAKRSQRYFLSWDTPRKEKNDIYIYMIIKIERDTIKLEIGNFIILMKYYIVTKRRRYFISWDTTKTSKTIYIYIWKKIKDGERDKQIWDWQFHDINEISYRQRKKTIFLIMKYFQNSKNDVYIYEDWERDNQIWDWQVHDINEILYCQQKKTIFHIMRYIQNSKNDIYIYTNGDWERDNQIWDWQF